MNEVKEAGHMHKRSGWKRAIRTAMILGCLAGRELLFPVGGRAYFLDAVDGVRPAGMGEAFTSVADDTNALLFNPAGLTRIRHLEINGMYSDLFTGLNTRLYNGQQDHTGYNYLSLAIPLDRSVGTVGVGWAHFNTILYKENTFLLSYGRCLWSPYTMDLGVEIDAGVSLKGLQWLVEANEFTTDPAYFPYSERQKTAFTADAGVLATVYDGVQVGLSADNLIPADVGLTVKEYVPTVLRLGASYQLHWENSPLDSILSAAEVTARNQVYIPKAGVESRWFKDRLAVRAGINTEGLTAGLSVREQMPRSPLAIRMDYAFAYPWYLADTFGSHRIGLLLCWELEAPQALAPEGEAARAFGTYGLDERLIQNLRLGTALAQAVKDSAQTADESDREAARMARETAAQASSEASGQVAAEAAKITLLARQVNDAAVQADTQVQAMTQSLAAAESDEILKNLQDIAQSATRDVAEIQRIAAAVSSLRYAVPEKDKNSIVIGIQTDIRADFGTREQLEPWLQAVKEYVEAATKMKVEFREYNLDNLKNDFIHGYVDLLASYSPFFRVYAEQQVIKPVLTLQTRGLGSQACCLFVAKDQAFSRPEELQDRRLGYIHSEILPYLKDYFYAETAGYTNIHYFKNTFKFKSGVDALGALQMKGVDAIVAFEYMETIAENLNAEYPIGIKAIAKSKPIPNKYLYCRPSKNPAKQKQIESIITAMLHFHEHPAAAPVLKYFGVDRLTAE